MNLDQLYPYGFRSTLFDRLIVEDEYSKGLSLKELRDSVAQDLEDLLNTRIAKLDTDFDDYPQAKSQLFNLELLIL